MRCRALRTFRDKRTGEVSKKGAVLDLKPHRVAELVEAGVAEALEEAPKPAKDEKSEEE